jgi:hypothetical protein
MQSHEVVVMAAVAQSAFDGALEHASVDIKINNVIIMAALVQNEDTSAFALEHALPEMQNK